MRKNVKYTSKRKITLIDHIKWKLMAICSCVTLFLHLFLGLILFKSLTALKSHKNKTRIRRQGLHFKELTLRDLLKRKLRHNLTVCYMYSYEEDLREWRFSTLQERNNKMQ